MPQLFRSGLHGDPTRDVLRPTAASFISPTLIYRPCMAPANYLARKPMPPKSKRFACEIPDHAIWEVNQCLVDCD